LPEPGEGGSCWDKRRTTSAAPFLYTQTAIRRLASSYTAQYRPPLYFLNSILVFRLERVVNLDSGRLGDGFRGGFPLRLGEV